MWVLSTQVSGKLLSNFLSEGELSDQRPLFTKEFLTKSVLTVYAAQTVLSPLLALSHLTIMTIIQGTCVHYSSFTTGKQRLRNFAQTCSVLAGLGAEARTT